MILLVSYALIILTFRKRRMLFKAKEVIYTGYEIYLYILSYVVLMTSCLLIYLHVVQVVSMTSPLIMVTWLVPLVAYLTYESVLIFEKDLVFYKVNEARKEVIIYAVVDQRQDYLNIYPRAVRQTPKYN